MDTYTNLAISSIRHYLTNGKMLACPHNLPEVFLNKQAGVFVSLHNKSDNSLRGCIGTFRPTEPNMAAEIINNAVSAAFSDPRFPPLAKDELENLDINVDVLSSPEKILTLENHDPEKYGLIVRSDSRHTGLLLPDIGVETAEEQFLICCEKGNIDPSDKKIELFRFTVERHK
ncbi:MAG: AmmeMemoRadiSam system protein A [Patescibacteria group bacterium]|jgi:hypothetical protein